MKNLLKKGCTLIVMIIMCTVTTNVFAATLGTVYGSPEEGWNRYDDDDNMFTYENMYSWKNGDSVFLNGGVHTSLLNGNKPTSVKFNFIGKQFRLLNQCYAEGRNYNINVYIDNKLYNFSGFQSTTPGYTLYYESPELEYGEHVVSIEKNQPYSDGRICMDIVDILGTLKPYEALATGYVFNIETEKDIIQTNEEVMASITIDNITGITAEDIRIIYDSDKLQYIRCEEIDGIKLVYNNEKKGELRFILASKGESNIIDEKTILLNLKFKGIAPGEALVDVVKGRVSDGIEMEKDIDEDKCGEAVIIIEEPDIPDDVDHSGEFTLLDLGIDARHFGKDPKSEELTKYNTDVVINVAIDEDDLLAIGKYMLENPNYPFN